MKKLKIITAVSVIFTLSVIVLYLNERTEKEAYKRSLVYYSEMAEVGLNESADNIAIALSKCAVTEDEKTLKAMCADVNKASSSALFNLSILQNYDGKYNELYTFFSLAEDYSYAILTGFEDSNIYSSLSELKATANNVLTYLSDTVNSDFPILPSLTYDGKMSGDYNSQIYTSLYSREEITKEEAEKNISERLDINGAVYTGEINGELPCYVFENSGTRITVSKSCGKIISYNVDKTVTESKISVDEAEKSAEEFLKRLSFEGLLITDYRITDNTAMFRFSPKANEFICSCDCISVKVSLSEGEILQLDATEYFKYNCERTLPEGLFDIEADNQYLHGSLSVYEKRKTILHSNGNRDVYCYEYRCTDPDGKNYAVYSDAKSGKIYRVNLLLEDENGVITK